MIMGEKAGQNDIFTCCWMLAGVGGVGVAAAVALVVNDRSLGVEKETGTSISLGVELLGSKGALTQQEAQDVEAAGGQGSVLGK